MDFGYIFTAPMNIFVRRTSHVWTFRFDYKVPLIVNIPILCAWDIIVWVISVLVRPDAKVMLLHLIIVIVHTFQAFLFLLSILVWIGHKSSIKRRVHGSWLSHGVCVANIRVEKRDDSWGWLIATWVPFLWFVVFDPFGHDACIFGLLEMDGGWWGRIELFLMGVLVLAVSVSTNYG